MEGKKYSKFYNYDGVEGDLGMELSEKSRKIEENIYTRPIIPHFKPIIASGPQEHRTFKSKESSSSSTNLVIRRNEETQRNGQLSPLSITLILSLHLAAISIGVFCVISNTALQPKFYVQVDPYCLFDVYQDSCSKPFKKSLITFSGYRANKVKYDVDFTTAELNDYFIPRRSFNDSRPFNMQLNRFVAPFDGIYYFNFRGYKGTHSCDVSFNVNKKSELFKCPVHTKTGGLVSWNIMKVLNANDTVYLKTARYGAHKNETFFICNPETKIEFIGMLLKNAAEIESYQ